MWVEECSRRESRILFEVAPDEPWMSSASLDDRGATMDGFGDFICPSSSSQICPAQRF
jgi:hypothetical protein